jgi:hypothetical protein
MRLPDDAVSQNNTLSTVTKTNTLNPVPAVAQTPQKAPSVAGAPRLGALTPPTAIPGGTQVPSAAPSAAPTNPVPATPAPPTALGEAMTPLPAMAPMPASPTATGLGPGAQGTPTNPANPLTNQTISRAPTADRFQLAQDRFKTFTDQTAPAYQAALRDANRMGAAAGGLGSGQLRTSLGDLGAQRDLNLRTNERGFLTDALEGTIADSFGDVAIGQQQQGFQNEQQQQAFLNKMREIGFSDEMLNSAFGRQLQTYMAGQAGGTGSGTGLAVGQDTSAAGGDAMTELMNMIRNRNAAPTPQAPATPAYNPGWRF